MDRLTSEDGICVDCPCITYCRTDCHNKKMHDKLKRYEDLGFTPEDIAYMAKFFNEHTSAEAIADNMRIVAMLLKAERNEAYWIKHEYADIVDSCIIPNYECSECGTWERDNSDYCPDCGSKMTEVK